MAPRFFISHSSVDKPLAIEIAECLKGTAWVDLYEIDIGNVLLEEIAEGITQASDFVLLWSVNSEKSKWVRFEFHMAFIRWLEDSAITLRIIALDNTELPLYFRPFLQGRGLSDPSEIAAQLSSPPRRRPMRRVFLDRSDDTGAIEATYYSGSVAVLWFWGVPGIGKRAIAREGTARLFATPDQYKRAPITPGTQEIEFDLILSSALGTSPVNEGAGRVAALDDALRLFTDFYGPGGVWIFEEAQHWLTEDAEPAAICQAILDTIAAVNDSTQRLVIFTSTRRPRLDPVKHGFVSVRRVSGLAPDFGAGLLRMRNSEASDDRLKAASEALDGHPLALEIVAQNLDVAERNWEGERLRFATEIMGRLSLSESAIAFLERLAVIDGPLPASTIAEHLGLDGPSLQQAIAEIESFGLASESTVGYLEVHPLVKDFYVRSLRRREGATEIIGALADRALEHYRLLLPGSAAHLGSMISTFRLLGLSLRLGEALQLRSDLAGQVMAIGIELYHQRRYRDALRYLDEVHPGNDGYREVSLYQARCLAHLDNLDAARSIVDELIRQYPNDHRILGVRARIEYIAQNWAEAIRWYEVALSKRRTYQLLVGVGQAYLRNEEWVKARATLEEAIKVGYPDHFALSSYSQVLEHFEQYDEAFTILQRAIEQDPTNAGYFHRFGRIAEAIGDRDTAVNFYGRAIELDNRLTESHFSLASVLAERGDTEGAERVLDGLAAHMSHREGTVVLNIRAKICLVKGDLLSAARYISSALDRERSSPNLGLKGRVLLAQVHAGVLGRSEAREELALLVQELRALGADGEAQRIESEM